jgi:hypothetical protein
MVFWVPNSMKAFTIWKALDCGSMACPKELKLSCYALVENELITCALPVLLVVGFQGQDRSSCSACFLSRMFEEGFDNDWMFLE